MKKSEMREMSVKKVTVTGLGDGRRRERVGEEGGFKESEVEGERRAKEREG